MKKKVLLTALAAIMALGMAVLTGCGGGSDELTDWEYIQDKGTLVVGLDDTFAPMGFRDENDELVGFDIDLARAVGEELGVEVEFQPIDWDAKEAELEAKNIDCIWNGMSATPERQESMSLSNKYMNNRIVIMSLDENINITDVSQLKDIKIGVQADSAALETVKAHENYADFADNIAEYPTYDEAILDMKAGRIDVVAIDEVFANYTSENKTKMYQSDFDFGDDFYAIGFRKGDTELTAKVNDALQATIDNGKAEEISNKWFGKMMVINEGYDE
jgi:polar amino acid transport system substrate-binding protein